MGEFYIRQPDELYHYGVKGMRWGVRHDPERTGRQRASKNGDYKPNRGAKIKKAAKVGAVVAVTALAAYGTYKYGPKMSGMIAKGAAKVRNKKADPFAGYKVREISSYNREVNDAIKRADRMADMASGNGKNAYRTRGDAYRLYRKTPGYNAGFDIRQGNSVGIIRDSKLTGHSGRVTKAGAARNKVQFYSKKVSQTSPGEDYFTDPLFNQRRRYERRLSEASRKVEESYKGTNQVKYYKTTPVNKLKRKKR